MMGIIAKFVFQMLLLFPVVMIVAALRQLHYLGAADAIEDWWLHL